MANYNSLKAAINAYIKRNGQRKITGDILNAVLNAAVDALGAGYQFMGVAGAATDPGTPDVRVFYIAPAGTYPSFGGTVVPEGSIGIFSYGDAWSYEVMEIGGGGSADAVLYVEQTLTSDQKAQARSNIGAGTGNGTYSKPSGGIPSTDLAQGVRDSLALADSAYQKPSDGIPATDIEEGVIPTDVVRYAEQSLSDSQKSQARTNIGAGTYSKPSGGITKSDLASGVQTSLEKADTAVQPGDLPTVPTITLNGSETTSPSFYAPTGTGTQGQVLTSNGSGAPTWQNAPSGGVQDVTLGGTSVVSGGVAVLPAIPVVEALTTAEIDTIWNAAMA